MTHAERLTAAVAECERLKATREIAGDFSSIISVVHERFELHWTELFDAWCDATNCCF